jgi:hypothetical protein
MAQVIYCREVKVLGPTTKERIRKFSGFYYFASSNDKAAG